MLQITVDLFSGRPNPTWLLAGEAADEVLAEIARNPAVISGVSDFPAILGFRGVEIRLSEDLARRHELPRAFRIATGRAADEEAGRALAERLLDTVPAAEPAGAEVYAADEPGPPDPDLVELLRRQVHAAPVPPDRGPLRPGAPGAPMSAAAGVAAGEEEPRIYSAYRYEAFGWDPNRWNTSPYQGRNNCYCYATDQRIDYFGVPGYGGTGKKITPPFTTPQVTVAIQADGAVPRARGPRDSLRARHMFAMVLGYYEAGVGYRDYHFYRQLAGGVWGHKAGNTPAITTDDAGRTIYDPEACSRPNYPLFCGYFFTRYRMKIGGNRYP